MKLHPLEKSISEELANAQKVVIRQRKETLREVYLAPPEFVYKRYEINRFSLYHVKPWLAEAQALEAARGCHVPRHITLFAGRNKKGHYEVVHKKGYVEGDVIGDIGVEQAQKIAVLIASLHARKVISRDPQKKNFYQGEDNNIYLIDFGKARVYRYRSVLYLYDIASELAKLERLVFDSREELWRVFIEHYYQSLPTKKMAKKITSLLFNVCVAGRNRRRGALI